MVEWIVSSAVLIAVVILLRLVLKGKISLRLQYALWAVVLVRLLVPVSFGDTAMSVGNLTQKAASSEVAQLVSALSETELPRMSYQAAYNEVAKEYADKGIRIEDIPLNEYAETVDYAILDKMDGGLSISDIVKIVWISGVAVVGFWFLLSNLRLQRRLKKSRVLLTDSHALPVYLSDAIDTPCLFGLFRPAIYLSSEAIESEDIQRHAIVHELTHFRHKDHIWAVLRSLCLAVHWFNPLVWYAAVLSRNDAELACDESAILRLGEEERASYGRTLLRLTCEKRPALLNTATTMTGSGKYIKERITLIAKKPRMAFYTLIAALLIIAVAVGCTFTGAEESDTPWRWAQTLSAEDVTASVTLWQEDGSSAALTDQESAALVQLLNALEDSNFTENTHLRGGTPTYGLTIQTNRGEYHINESTAPSGSLEMHYGGRQWWIDAKALSDFILQAIRTDRSSFSGLSELPHENGGTVSKDAIQEIINHILVGALSYDESWQSAGAYTLTVSASGGRSDSYLCLPETYYSLAETPGCYVKDLYDWTLGEAWDNDFSNSGHILTMSNAQFALTLYSNECKMKITDRAGSTMYLVGIPRDEGAKGAGQDPAQLFLHFRQYAMQALETYELYSCAVDGSETDYIRIAQALSEQYARMVLDRPDWYPRCAQDAKVGSVHVFDAYYGKDTPNFCFNLDLYLKISEDQVRYWQAGAGLSEPSASGEFAGYYGAGSEVKVKIGEDGRWRMEGFASGGAAIDLPIAPEEANAKQLVELFFLSSGFSRDWRILSAMCERPLEDIQAQLGALDTWQQQELISELRTFCESYPDICSWHPDALQIA